MMDEREPERLTDDAATPAELDRLLRGVRRGGHDPRSRAAVEAGLGALLDPATPSAATPPDAAAPAPSSSFVRAGLGAAIGLGVLALGVWLLAPRASSPVAPRLPEAPVAQPVERAPEPTPPPPAAPTDEPTPARTSDEPPSTTPAVELARPRAVRPAPRDTERAETPAAPNQAPTELTLLREARQLATSQPARALELCEVHRRTYPTGVLSEERAAIEIEALVALGRRDEAARRAEAFLRRHPTSAHRARIDALLRAPR